MQSGNQSGGNCTEKTKSGTKWRNAHNSMIPGGDWDDELTFTGIDDSEISVPVKIHLNFSSSRSSKVPLPLLIIVPPPATFLP